MVTPRSTHKQKYDKCRTSQKVRHFLRHLRHSSQARENIGLYQGLQEAQAGQNQDLASKRVGLASVPGAMRDDRAMKFGNLAQAKMQGRTAQAQMQYQANAFNQTQPGFGESLLKGIGSLLQPFKGGGGQ